MAQTQQSMWTRTQEIAKRHDQNAGHWLKLQNDGDKAVVVFLGEPHPREVCFIDNKYVPFDENLKSQGFKPTLRVALNAAIADTKEVKVIEQGVTFFKDLIQVRDKYTLEKWAFEVQRHGAAKDPKTKYSILPERQLSAEDQKAFQSLEQHDLAALYDSANAESAFPIEQANDPDPVVLATLASRLKMLPREAVERFCSKFGITRIKELTRAQVDSAVEFVLALEAQFKGGNTSANPFE